MLGKRFTHSKIDIELVASHAAEDQREYHEDIHSHSLNQQILNNNQQPAGSTTI